MGHPAYSSVPTDAPDVEPALSKSTTKLDPKWLALDADATPWYRRPRAQRYLKAAMLALLAINVVAAVHAIIGFACGPPRGLDGIECLHALGGGDASNGGSFDSAIVHGPHCRRVIANYLRPGGAYWHEVDIAAGRGFDYFKAAAPARGPNDTVVFDIDETVLSNLDEFLNATGIPHGCHRHRHHHHPPHHPPHDGPHGPHDGPSHHGPGHHHPHHKEEDDDEDDEDDKHGPGRHHPHHGPGHHDDDDEDDKDDVDVDRRPPHHPHGPPRKPLQLGAPPIPPMLRLYRFLYEQGYTVTFVTGRSEAARNATEANLAAAGFGAQCAVDGATGAAVRSADGEPCWLQLDMREEGDHRLASVYKPDRRGRLMARGFKLVGSFGDQFSDLAGENAAGASFKLPNPMYYIL